MWLCDTWIFGAGDQVRPLYRTISLFRDGTEFLHWPPLTLVHLLAFVLVVATISNAQGFRPNAGQFDAARNQPFDSSVLFTLQDERFYQTSVDVAAGLTIQFVNANLAAVVTGESLLAYPVNIYYGPPSYWRENVPQFSTIHYAQIYSGIDLEWHTAPDAKLRILVAPGANLNQIVMRCNRPIAASPSGVRDRLHRFPHRSVVKFLLQLGRVPGFAGIGFNSIRSDRCLLVWLESRGI